MMLRSGKLPRDVRAELAQEGIVYLREGVRASVTLRRYRDPNRISLLRRRWFRGAVLVTRRRIAVYARGRRVIGLAREDPRMARLEVRAERPSLLCISLEAGDFAAGHMGRVEYRLRVDDAARLARLIVSPA